MFKNYVFDLYGTLIDINTNEKDKKLWKKLSILYMYKGACYSPKQIENDYARYVAEEKAQVRKRHPEYIQTDIKIEKVFLKLFSAKGIKVTKREIAEICTSFRCYSTDYIKLYDGVIDLLDILKTKGRKIYLLSNAQRGFTENELSMFGLTEYFDGIMISSDEECSKPDIHFYNMLIDRYKLKREETVMIGNDYSSDIKGARDAGLKSLYIHQSISPELKGGIVSDFKVMDGNVRKIKELIVK